MVFFTCNACGQAVKKNQVEKHYTMKCRNCTVLSCIDCGKDFRGVEYQTHTKCITEDEKYGGKDYKPKPSAGKGEAKQVDWIMNIKNYMSTANLSGNMLRLLNRLVGYDNIPRKKNKFQNFVRNSIRLGNPALWEEAWNIFTEANKPAETMEEQKSEVQEVTVAQTTNTEGDKSTSAESDTTKKHKKKKKSKDREGDLQVSEQSPNANSASEVQNKNGRLEELNEGDSVEGDLSSKLKKKKKKKHRKENLDTEEQEHSTIAVSEILLSNGHTKRKSKKQPTEDLEPATEETQSKTEHEECTGDLGEVKKKKKRKRKENENFTELSANETTEFCQVADDIVYKPKQKKKKHKKE